TGCQNKAGDVTSSPWLVLGTTAERGRILTGGDTNTIRAGFGFNSVPQAVDASEFPATPVTFSGVLGTVQTPATTDGGIAQTLFTAGGVAGNGSATATVD